MNELQQLRIAQMLNVQELLDNMKQRNCKINVKNVRSATKSLPKPQSQLRSNCTNPNPNTLTKTLNTTFDCVTLISHPKQPNIWCA